MSNNNAPAPLQTLAPEAPPLAREAGDALGRGDLQTARELCEELSRQCPEGGEAHYLLGAISFSEGAFNDACAHLWAADAAKPEQAQTLNLLARAFQQSGNINDARNTFARAGALGLAQAWCELGRLEGACGDVASGIAAFRRALELTPTSPDAHAGLAHLLEIRHDLSGAKMHALRALALDPANASARLVLGATLLREGAFAEAELAAMPLADALIASREDRAIAWNLIGEARDRRGEPHGAFRAFTVSNQLQLAQYSAVRDMPHPAHPNCVREMTRFTATLDVSIWCWPAFDTDAPVFLVGFPRSGTTLLDQVLSSHSRIVCLEEKDYLWDALSEVMRDGDTLERISALTNAEIVSIRHAYWRQVAQGHAHAPGEVLVDRQPLHIVLLPLIKRVFPDAKIIFALRDPRDVVLSCYQQCFAINVAMAQFLELEIAASYYDAVMQLFTLCRDRLGFNILEVRYKNVVVDLKTEARRLASFLDLPFEAAMLDHRSTALDRTIKTASARQVIEPVYVRSLGRWRRYEQELAPVLPLLNTWAARFGYE